MMHISALKMMMSSHVLMDSIRKQENGSVVHVVQGITDLFQAVVLDQKKLLQLMKPHSLQLKRIILDFQELLKWSQKFVPPITIALMMVLFIIFALMERTHILQVVQHVQQINSV